MHIEYINEMDLSVCIAGGMEANGQTGFSYLGVHLLPKGNPLRDDERFIVTACRFCNEPCNRTMFPVQGKTPQEIIEMKRIAMARVRNEYHHFWEENIENQG